MIYYKSFNDLLQGRNNYQFEINKIYQIDHSDTWEWFHFAEYISSTLIHNGKNNEYRICVVEPLGKINKFPARYDGYNKGNYFTTNRIKICRELSKEEIFEILIEEKCSFHMLLEYTIPSFEYLFNNKKKIRGDHYCRIIANRKDFTNEEKYKLLPKSQYKRLVYIPERNLREYVLWKKISTTSHNKR